MRHRLMRGDLVESPIQGHGPIVEEARSGNAAGIAGEGNPSAHSRGAARVLGSLVPAIRPGLPPPSPG